MKINIHVDLIISNYYWIKTEIHYGLKIKMIVLNTYGIKVESNCALNNDMNAKICQNKSSKKYKVKVTM